ncbi:MAG TPA: type II toxin-antitoxin system VapC family toxin [Thermoanaerobaculia bacterium]|jgi:PIN domain nuclease of toxin-antitoxin system|nr:type II toxin-antitoxin system VapC family toxin [Thermoanaerobaculia bacterium]
MASGRLLLDTHVFLWWQSESVRIKPETRQSILEAELVFVSAASVWEAAIKSSIGKLRLPAPVHEGFGNSGFEMLPVTFSHAAGVADLPFHHRDPFDRLLIAQARAESLVLVTRDREFEDYPVEILRA